MQVAICAIEKLETSGADKGAVVSFLHQAQARLAWAAHIQR
jgi:hypothetical protein